MISKGGELHKSSVPEGGPYSPERKEERNPGFSPVYIYGEQRSYTAISVNYSKCGLCMITNLDVEPGDEITVACSLFWPNPKKGRVVWTSPISLSSRKAGIYLCEEIEE